MRIIWNNASHWLIESIKTNSINCLTGNKNENINSNYCFMESDRKLFVFCIYLFMLPIVSLSFYIENHNNNIIIRIIRIGFFCGWLNNVKLNVQLKIRMLTLGRVYSRWLCSMAPISLGILLVVIWKLLTCMEQKTMARSLFFCSG